MTALAIGSSVTAIVRDGGTVAIATNGGLGSVTRTAVGGTTATINFGPEPTRRIFGPYSEGASVSITNISCNAFDYDPQTTDAASDFLGAFAWLGLPDPASYAGYRARVTDRGYYALSDGVSWNALYSPAARGAKSSIGTKCPYGFMDTGAQGVDRNFHVQTTCEAPFDAVRVILFNSHTATITGVKASCGPAAQLGTDGTSAVYTPDSWTDVTWAAASSVTQAAGSANRPSITVSDWMQVNSVARTDSGSKPVLHVRVFVPAANATVSKWSPGGVAAWLRNETTAGGRPWRAMVQDVADAITTKANFTSTADASRWYPVAIQYMARGVVTTIAAVGDSIAGGIGATNYLDSQYWRARAQLSTAGAPLEVANFGWSGQATSASYLRALDLMNNGVIQQGDVLCYHAFSPNDFAGSVTAAGIASMQFYTAQVFQLAKQTRVRPVVINAEPVNPASKAWGATDALRVAYNGVLASYPAVDVATPLSGITDGTGQVNFAAGDTTDNLHPNDAGINAIVPAVAAAVGAVLV